MYRSEPQTALSPTVHCRRLTWEPPDLSERDFSWLSRLIYERTGILIKENKKYLLENRLAERMAELGCSSYQDYVLCLQRDTADVEFQKLINAITNNETRFLRNFPQLKDFQSQLLPELVRACESKRHTLVIWSAGCSTGEEPYTLAMLVGEKYASLVAQRQVEIIGTDINTEVIAHARRGYYSQAQAASIPPIYLARFFRKVEQGYEVGPMLRSIVRFEVLNLLDTVAVRRLFRMVDVIFFRNVMIYFGEEKRRLVIDTMYDILRPGGFLFLGHSESLHGLSKAFKVRSLGKTLVYYKEGPGPS